MAAKNLTKSKACSQVRRSLPMLEARMRAQFAAYYQTMREVVTARAAEARPVYGKKSAKETA